MSLPVGQEYRDLLKLIPGVQYSQDTVRGPSAGGSGQDNVYNFDGVNVTLPLFGTLVVRAVVARHRAGHHRPRRRARRRLRSVGRLHHRLGQQVGHQPLHRRAVSWQVMTQDMVAALQRTSASRYEQDRNWFTVNAGGPVIPQPAELLRLVLPSAEHQGEPRQPLRRAAELRAHPQRRLRQADVHADQLGAAQLQLSRFAPPRHQRPVRLDRLGDDGDRQRGVAEDRHARRIVGRSTRAAT